MVESKRIIHNDFYIEFNNKSDEEVVYEAKKEIQMQKNI